MKYKCRTASTDRWLAVAAECRYATYFHTPYWYGIIVPGQKHAALEVVFDDGASALIPVARIKRLGGLLADHFSSPGGTYGGWISASALSREHVEALIGVLSSKKNLTFRVNPLCGMPAAVLSLVSTPSSTPRLILPSKQTAALRAGLPPADSFTHILDLTKGRDEIRKGLSKGHRSAIRSAARDGVTVRAAESFAEWERYYGLYMESVGRWRAGGAGSAPRTVYPLELFRRIYESRTGNEILWLAFKGGEPVAGALFFYWNRHAVSWHGASSPRHFNLRPNNLLYWEIIGDAIGRGYGVFDFNPSGGYAGVESFKEHFGAERVPSPVLLTRTPLRLAVSRLRSLLK